MMLRSVKQTLQFVCFSFKFYHVKEKWTVLLLTDISMLALLNDAPLEHVIQLSVVVL